MNQTTIAKKVELSGIGLHKAVVVRLRLEPMEENSGIVFYREDAAKTIELKPENVVLLNKMHRKIRNYKLNYLLIHF